MEIRSGSIYIRQPDQLLETGHIVDGHLHNFDHTTFFSSGVWHVECFGLIVDDDGKPVMDEKNRPTWYKIKDVTIRSGGPGAYLLIQANCKHKFTLLEGPGMYACIYSHRTYEGDVVPEYTGWTKAYV